MLFSGFRRKKHLQVGDVPEELGNRRTLLNFYRNAPTEDISLQEFEDLAVERLKGKCRSDGCDRNYINVSTLVVILFSSASVRDSRRQIQQALTRVYRFHNGRSPETETEGLR